MRRFKTLASACKMPRNAGKKPMLTIYTFALIPRDTRFRRPSGPYLLVQWCSGTNSRSSSSGRRTTSCFVWKSTAGEQNLVSLILIYYKKPKLCLSLSHARRNLSQDWFSATCWSYCNLPAKVAILVWHRWFSLGDVTAHGRVQDRPRRERPRD